MTQVSITNLINSISEYAHEMGFEPVVIIDNFYGEYGYEVE